MICGIFPSARAIKRLFGNRSRTIFLQVSCTLRVNVRDGICHRAFLLPEILKLL